MFCIRTLSCPDSLPRQFLLAKLPSSFSHIFSIFFFVSSYPAQPLSGVLKSKTSPLLVNLSFFFCSGAPLLDLIFVNPHFLCFICHISFLKYPWFMSRPDAMCYLCYFYIAVLFNTFPTSVFVHFIFSKNQWFASVTVKIQLNDQYYLTKKWLDFQACSFTRQYVSMFW